MVEITPNLQIVLPEVGPDGTPGPTWAAMLNTAFASPLDNHDHSAGKGVRITPAGLNINTDLTLNTNNLISARSVRLNSQGSTFSNPLDVTTVYVVNGELVYRDLSGTNVQITDNGGINISSVGTIGGDYGQPGVPAAVTYSDTTKVFTFSQSAGIGASIASSSIRVAAPIFGAQTVTLTAASGTTAHTITLPTAGPSVNGSLISFNTDGTSCFTNTISSANLCLSGTLVVSGTTCFNGPVCATSTITTSGTTCLNGATCVNGATNFAGNTTGRGIILKGMAMPLFNNLTGADDVTATTAADANGFVVASGQTIVDATSPMNGTVIPNINNNVFLMGNTTAGTAGGANSTTLSVAQLPVHCHTITHNHAAGAVAVCRTHCHTMNHGHSNTFSLTGNTATVASSTHIHTVDSHTHTIANHQHCIGNSNGTGLNLYNSSGGTTTAVAANLAFNGGGGGINAVTFGTATYCTTSGGGGNTGGATPGTGGPSATCAISVGLTGSVTSFSGNTGDDVWQHTHGIDVVEFSGNSDNVGSGSTIDNRPSFITAKWVMRIK